MATKKTCALDKTNDIITPAQARAGRAILSWTAERLAAKAGLHVQTVRKFEWGRHACPATLRVIQAALMVEGVILEQGYGWHGIRFADRPAQEPARR